MDTEALLAQMTLDEKVGQLFLLAFSKDRLDEARILFQDYFVGGSYLSNENIPDPQAASVLTASLQTFAAQTRLKVPLLLGVDQEGAWGVMVPGSCTGPGNMALGAAHSAQSTTQMYQVIGAELAAVGVNTLLAPSADCNSNPANSIIGMRSFGEDPKLVGTLAAAAVRGAHAGGVATTVKHFPGHGDTRTDSHRGLPLVDRTREELYRIDLHPFIDAIQAGVDIVMTSHIIFSALDPENPATLSKVILQDILRDQLGFAGVVLSDSMNMHSMKRNYRPEDSAIQAILAGVDMIMLAEEGYDHDAAHYIERQTALIQAVKAAVEHGQIPTARIDQAVARILQLKVARGLFAAPVPHSDLTVVGTTPHRALELEVSRKAVSFLRNGRGLLPVATSASVTLVNATQKSSYTALESHRGIGPNQTTPAFDYFVDAMRSKFTNLVVVSAETYLFGEFEFEAQGPIIAVTENYPLAGMDFDQSSQVEIVNRLASAAPDRLIVVALRDPYELALFPAVQTYLCAFSFRECAAQAAAEALCGDYAPNGKTPVAVPGAGLVANVAVDLQLGMV